MEEKWSGFRNFMRLIRYQSVWSRDVNKDELIVTS